MTVWCFVDEVIFCCNRCCDASGIVALCRYRSAMTYTINPEGAQHAFDFRKHAQEYLRAEGRWAAHPVAEGKEATPSGDSDSDNEEAPSTETKTTDGAGEEERPVWEVRPNRAYAVRYFKRDDDM